MQILNIRADRYSAGQQSNRFAFTVGGLAVIAAVAVNAVVDFNLRVPGNLFTLLAITSAVLTCGVHRRANEEEPVPRPGRHVTLRMGGLSRLVLVAGLAMVLALLLTRLGHSFPSTLFRARGDRAAAQLSWSDAESAYLRAWRFDRRNFETAIALGDLFSVRATWNIRQRETLAAQALSWYRRARTLNPYAYDVLIRIARLQDALGQRDPARATYREALQNDPKNASYHAQFGWHYQRWGEPDLAQRSFRLARRFGATEILPASEPQKTDTAGS